MQSTKGSARGMLNSNSPELLFADMDDEQYTCEECSQIFFGEKSYYKHLITHLSARDQTSKDNLNLNSFNDRDLNAHMEYSVSDVELISQDYAQSQKCDDALYNHSNNDPPNYIAVDENAVFCIDIDRDANKGVCDISQSGTSKERNLKQNRDDRNRLRIISFERDEITRNIDNQGVNGKLNGDLRFPHGSDMDTQRDFCHIVSGNLEHKTASVNPENMHDPIKIPIKEDVDDLVIIDNRHVVYEKANHNVQHLDNCIQGCDSSSDSLTQAPLTCNIMTNNLKEDRFKRSKSKSKDNLKQTNIVCTKMSDHLKEDAIVCGNLTENRKEVPLEIGNNVNRTQTVYDNSSNQSDTLLRCDKTNDSLQQSPFISDIIDTSLNKSPNVCDISDNLKQSNVVCGKPDDNLKLDSVKKNKSRRFAKKRTHKRKKRKSCHKCEVCEKTYKTMESLRIHQKLHTGESVQKCKICSKYFHIHRIADHIKRHNANVKKTFKCDICQKTFASKHYYHIHLRIHSDHKPFKCNMCEKSFNRNDSLKNHTCDASNSQANKCPCNICGKKYSKGNLKAHMLIHLPDEGRPFQCEICHKRFAHPSNLKSHMRLHKDERRFQCAVCEMKFFRNTHLRAHMHIHTGKRFRCDLCKKSFSLPRYLEDHKLRVHSEYYHPRVKEKPVIKSFKCEICGKVLSRKTRLEDHKRLHTGEKSKKCDLCEESFVSMYYLHAHKKKKHSS